jgi:ribonuclease P protein component
VIHNHRLPRTARLSDDEAVKAFRSNAQALRGRWFVVRRMGNAVGYPRLTIRVGKKVVRAAVARNRIRRVVREAFRLRRRGLPSQDFLISVRADLTDVTMSEARRDLERLLPRAP